MVIAFPLPIPGAQTVPVESVEAAQPVEQPTVRTWHVVSTLTGENLKRGEVFELTSSTQRLSYTVADGTGMAYVYLVEEGKALEREGGLPEVNAAAKNGETMLYKTPGRYYIDVIGVGGEWSVTLEELR